MPPTEAPAADLIRVDVESAPAVVVLGGDWGVASRLPDSAEVADRLRGDRVQSVTIDGSALAQPHPRVAAFVRALAAELTAHGRDVSYRDLGANLAALMALAGERSTAPEAPPRQAQLFERVGLGVRAYYDGMSDALGFFGRAVTATPGFVSGRSQTRWRDFIDYLKDTGANSLPVVTVVNLLVGAVLGFVGAIQLGAFGAGFYLADLVGVAVAREMAALMTAFVMAGRVGATFAAHLATMQANEEVDALRMTGVSPFEFLVMPRLAALSIMIPLLYVYAAAIGIVGGLLVAELVIGTPPAAFVHRLHAAIDTRHFIIGFAKSICFGVMIALTSCYLGLNAGRNAAEVGRSATRTVVICIIGIIVIDAVFALCTNALGV